MNITSTFFKNIPNFLLTSTSLCPYQDGYKNVQVYIFFWVRQYQHFRIPVAYGILIWTFFIKSVVMQIVFTSTNYFWNPVIITSKSTNCWFSSSHIQTTQIIFKFKLICKFTYKSHVLSSFCLDQKTTLTLYEHNGLSEYDWFWTWPHFNNVWTQWSIRVWLVLDLTQLILSKYVDIPTLSNIHLI